MYARILTLAAAVACSLISGTTLAAIEATSKLSISGFTVNASNPGAITPLGGPNESWIFDVEMDTVTPGLVTTFGTTLDGTISSFGTLVADNAFPSHGTVGTPYIFADSDGSGTILSPGGASVTTMASIGADDTLPLAGATSSFEQLQVQSIRVTAPITLTFSFDALLEMDVTNTGIIPFVASASSGYSITINGTSTTGTPFNYGSAADGTLGIGALNDNLISIISPGSSISGPQVNQTFTSETISLNPGTYQFQITQTSFASLAQVPEPTTFAVWGLLASGAFGLCAGRRKRA
ncbi:hypothetical protein [Botrimarina mediterranea]|uniref:Ice-binding protein C-terminal domain-containing protein n=1 Tax=Botrimarina mediterranea TaxID=2528022 RepID=A0A518KBG7_9BACT|nr:hypothetical protein [Botrimarina mediterranea]QDV75132.1 hypothetical protein Spa11_33420 [Botrimarina mediterranea]QDV79778.1 hypothetical protein K2D_33940 [Planctomycetes bacterium K2D]